MLTHWPVQLHLISPGVSFFRNSDLLVAADCTAFACASFHEKLLAGRKVVVACPKLDTNQQSYLDKLITLFSNSGIRSVTIAIMEVPCCGALFQLVRQAIDISGALIPLKVIIIGADGNIKKEIDVPVSEEADVPE